MSGAPPSHDSVYVRQARHLRPGSRGSKFLLWIGTRGMLSWITRSWAVSRRYSIRPAGFVARWRSSRKSIAIGRRLSRRYAAASNTAVLQLGPSRRRSSHPSAGDGHDDPHWLR